MNDVQVTPELLADLERKAIHATSGCWESRYDDETGVLQVIPAGAPDGEFIFCHDYHLHSGVSAGDEMDAAFVVSAQPRVVLALVKRIRELEADLQEAYSDERLSQR